MRPLALRPLASKALSPLRALRQVHTEAKLAQLGLVLPELPQPAGSYTLGVQQGSWVYLAGHLPFKEDMKTPHVGRLGFDLTKEEGNELARLTGLELIATLKKTVGDLDKVLACSRRSPRSPLTFESRDPQVKRIVKVNGYIACTGSFTELPFVLNGCSNLMGEVFGDRGVHSRAAVGVTTLPLGVPIEIDLVAEVDSNF